ncbi:MAG: ABC transporter permease, partial [Chloroflexi bacterium]|nr:ABC transporter permease [Chloroflexota bacterium]
GMTRRQILGLVLTEAAVLGALGSALGVGFGVLLARGLIAMLGAVVATEISTLSVPTAGVLQSLLVGGLVTLGSALLPARQAARVSPLEALRSQATPTVIGGASRLAWMAGLELMGVAYAALYHIPWRVAVEFPVGSLSILILMFGATLTVPLVVRPLEWLLRPVATWTYGNEGRLGSGNVQRSPGRTSLTVAALMIGISMVIGIGSLTTSFETDITSWLDTALGGDLYVRAPLPMREQFGRQLAAVEGVGGITPVRYFAARVAPASVPADMTGDDTIIFAAVDPATYRQVGQFQFAVDQRAKRGAGNDAEANWERLAQNGALFVSTVVADRFHLQQGDTLRLITRRGEHDFYVAAVAVDFTGQGFIVSGTYDDMRRWFSQSGADRFTIKVAPGYTIAQVRQNIEDKYKASRNISVETTEEFKSKILTLSAQSFQLFDVLGL